VRGFTITRVRDFMPTTDLTGYPRGKRLHVTLRARLNVATTAFARFAGAAHLESRATSAGIWVLLASVALVVVSMLLGMGAAMDSRRLLWAFDYDENFVVGMVLRSLNRGDLKPLSDLNPRNYFFDYGMVYQGIAYHVVRFYERLGYARTVYLVAYVLRFVSLLSWCVVGAVLYRVSRRLGIANLPALTTTIVAVGGTSFAAAGAIVHPDVLQAALIALSLACLLGNYSLLRVLASSALAGLAFGVKYGGVFVLPALAAFILMGELTRRGSAAVRAARLAATSVAALVTFVGVWLWSNPFVFRRPAIFRDALKWREHHVEYGHLSRETGGVKQWLTFLASDFTWLGVVVIALGIGAAFGYVIAKLVARGSSRHPARAVFESPRRRFLVVLCVFCVTTTYFLFTRVHMQRFRYAFIGLPEWIVLGGFGLHRVERWLRPRSVRVAAQLGFAVLAVALSARSVVDLRGGPNRYVDGRLTLGEWLDEHYASGTVMEADLKTYIPPRFKVIANEILSSADVRMRPDVIVLSRQGTGRYCWKRDGTDFAQGDFECSDLDHAGKMRKMYDWLAHHGDYTVAREDGGTVVLERKPE